MEIASLDNKVSKEWVAWCVRGEGTTSCVGGEERTGGVGSKECMDEAVVLRRPQVLVMCKLCAAYRHAHYKR